MSIVNAKLRGRLGGTAPGRRLGRRGMGARGRATWLEGLMGKRFAQLGYDYAYPEDTAADQALYNSGTVYMPASSSYTQAQLAAMWNQPDTPLTLNPVTGIPYAAGGPSALPAGSSLSIPGSGAITPSEAALISQGITTAGKIGTQAIIGTPTVTYNAATGQYTATGGATIPAGSIAANSIFQTLLSPTVLLLGGGLLVVLAFAGKR